MKNNSSVNIIQNHPGVPGFDAIYDFEVILKGTRLFGDCCTISVDDPRVKVRGLSIAVPSELRDERDMINLSFSYTIKQVIIQTFELHFEKWERVFVDDFDDEEKFSKNWDPHNPYGTINEPDRNARFASDNIYLSNGQLVMEILEADDSTPQKPQFTCASMSTKNSFRTRHGCFSARVKFPEKGGTWSSFRLMNDDDQFFIENPYDITQSKGEISIFSYFPCLGENILTSMTYFGHEKYSKQFMKVNSVSGIMDGFSTLSCIWTPRQLFYYYNGNLVFTINEQVDQIKSELFLFFQLQVGYQDKYDWIGNFHRSMVPQKLIIDNVSVYRQIK